MAKYYVLMFAAVAIALFYAYVSDPCNMLVRRDFSNKHPDYTIVGATAEEGSPESVRCRVSYRKPDSAELHEELWLYYKMKQGWEFSKILKKEPGEPTP